MKYSSPRLQLCEPGAGHHRGVPGAWRGLGQAGAGGDGDGVERPARGREERGEAVRGRADLTRASRASSCKKENHTREIIRVITILSYSTLLDCSYINVRH